MGGGTLGESARAKVPVFAPDTGAPWARSASASRARASSTTCPRSSGVASPPRPRWRSARWSALLLRRRFERLTLGLQPEELVALVQNQAAVLDGVGDGVVALDARRDRPGLQRGAERMLGVDDSGRPRLAALGLPPGARHRARCRRAGARPSALLVGRPRALPRPPPGARAHGRDLGRRVRAARPHRPDGAVAERLETVRAMTNALRVQRHEFANRLHVAAGLIDAGRVDEARAFLAELRGRGPVALRADGSSAIEDPLLQSFLGAKAIEAAERGVRCASRRTRSCAAARGAEDVAAVLGNLVDNAVRRRARAATRARQVEVALLDDGDALAMTVADSGPGSPTPGGCSPAATHSRDRGVDRRRRARPRHRPAAHPRSRPPARR